MQSKPEIEDWYAIPDPWDYETNPEDAKRKDFILTELLPYGEFKRALDIGAGEGFITRDLPAIEIHAIEWSDRAAERLPVDRVMEPQGKYDLVIATGVLYPQYDHKQILEWIDQSAKGIILLSNIAAWEVPEVIMLGEPVKEMFYPYREYIQKLRIYDRR